ncbi:MAG: hypothetical protein ACI4MM_06350, partial [Candidatus Ventricola sp.]
MFNYNTVCPAIKEKHEDSVEFFQKRSQNAQKTSGASGRPLRILLLQMAAHHRRHIGLAAGAD